MWQKKDKGPLYRGHYLKDQNGERVLVLTAILSSGRVHSVTAESWQMLKATGWKKVS